VKIKKMPQVVRGENREVLFGVPYIEPQQKLQLDQPTQPKNIEGEILEKVKGLPAEQKKALLEALKETK
jgi:hypothetical protein